MNPSTAAREALVAELIGDMTQLIQRAEALAPEIDQARRALADAAKKVAGTVPPFLAEMKALSDACQRELMGQTESRAKWVATQIYHEQRIAMNDSARALFDGEVAPKLRGLTSTLDAMSDHVGRQLSQLTDRLDAAVERAAVERNRRPWISLLQHACTASWSAGVAALVVYLLYR